jgi:hypothetical protein
MFSITLLVLSSLSLSLPLSLPLYLSPSLSLSLSISLPLYLSFSISLPLSLSFYLPPLHLSPLSPLSLSLPLFPFSTSLSLSPSLSLSLPLPLPYLNHPYMPFPTHAARASRRCFRNRHWWLRAKLPLWWTSAPPFLSRCRSPSLQ